MSGDPSGSKLRKQRGARGRRPCCLHGQPGGAGL